MDLLKKIAQHFIQNIITSDNFLNNAPVKDVNLLFPEMKLKVEKLLKQYSESGGKSLSNFKVFESYRSAKRQKELYQSGASQRSKNGMHHFGIAVDIVNYTSEGWAWKGDYAKLTDIADDLGLTHLNFEQCHYQLIPVSKQDDLVATITSEVIALQKNNGLVPDGIVGPKTIAKAKEVYKK